MTLKLIKKESRINSEEFQRLIKALDRADGFVVVTMTRGGFNYYHVGMSHVDIIFACEYAKHEEFKSEE